MKGRKIFNCLICGVLTFAILLGTNVSLHASPTNYTYTYDFWGRPIPSPDAYRVTAFILGEHLGIGHFSNPQDLFIRDNRIYVVDTGNNRIVILLAHDDASHEVYQVIDHVLLNGAPSTFNQPLGIFVSDWGERWIADTRNQRILHIDEQWRVINEVRDLGYTLPEFEGMDFLPAKLAVDFTGRMFVQALNVNEGLMEFDSSGEFVGYMGATPVQVSPIEQFWRMIATQEQRERRALFVPTEYNNVTIDHEGFLFVTTNTGGVDIEPVRRLNAMGDDIMIRNGRTYPIGDLVEGTAAGISGPSQFIDVAPLPNDTFVAFDRTRGRLFAYDFQGNLLYVFGGSGNREGYFMHPVALDSMGFALYALDSRAGAITRFDLTEYGTLINQALALYRTGQYEASADTWQEVLRLNGNFGMAYIGIARALLRQGYYREAMRYFRLEFDWIGYGRAFGFYRRQWAEENFWIFAIIVLGLLIVPPVVKRVMRVRKEIMEA